MSTQQTALPIDSNLLRDAVHQVLHGEEVLRGAISLAIVDNATIHSLNVKYLRHDYPTDVLSFLLDDSMEHWEGEIVVSAEMAAQQATGYGWSAEEELLLYVIHGLLHLAGHGDHDAPSQAKMRACEDKYLALLGRRRGAETDPN